MKTLILVFFAILFFFTIKAQNRVVYGEVNVFNNLKLQNIHVESKKTGVVSITDSTGQFAIVCEPNDILKIKSKVFRSKRIKVKPSTDSLKIDLNFIETKDNIDMAIGYGYIPKDLATYAYSNLNNTQEDFCTYNNIYALIKGKCPGVNVLITNSSPGADNEIIIRGKNSLYSSNNALLVVDGMITSSIAHLSPCDVKRIDILKDASASIYGSQGANGVILIETIK